MAKKIKTVNDIPENFTLVTDSQDIADVLEITGKSYMLPVVACMFVEVLDGEYGRLFYSEYAVPLLTTIVLELSR